MAHACPDCGQLCHCNGDIDDCEFNFPEDVMRCTHCIDESDIDDSDIDDLED